VVWIDVLVIGLLLRRPGPAVTENARADRCHILSACAGILAS
jgi:hypothetical protein